MTEKSTLLPVGPAWSDPIRGLSARLRVEFEDLRPGLRHAVTLELRNHSTLPVAVLSQPEIHAKLLGETGDFIAMSGLVIDGPSREPQWAVIPHNAYLGLRIDPQAAAVPARGQGVVLIAAGDRSWLAGVGRYLLRITAKFERKDPGPEVQWTGMLEVPPVGVEITREMVEEDRSSQASSKRKPPGALY
jgi:hypothetical protein